MTAQSFVSLVLPLIFAFIVHKLAARFIRVPVRFETPRTQTYITIIRSFVSLSAFAVAAYFIFTSLQINVTPLFASAGVVGIIVGLGTRAFLEDFFTGLLILTEDTIRIGEYVEIAGSEGVVESVGLRTVRIRDKNGAVHIFPNREIKKIVNYSKRQARVIIDLPLKPNQPIEKIETCVASALSVLRKDPKVGQFVHEKSRVEGVESITPGSIVLRVFILTKASERWNVARTFRKIVLIQLEKAKITLA
jgi:small-conductance mechanosensitive channel